MSETLRTAEEARERNEGLVYEESLAGRENAIHDDDAPSPLTCFTVQVFSDYGPLTYAGSVEIAEKLTALMAETEENLNAGVIPGFTFKIREWDEEES